MAKAPGQALEGQSLEREALGPSFAPPAVPIYQAAPAEATGALILLAVFAVAVGAAVALSGRRGRA